MTSHWKCLIINPALLKCINLLAQTLYLASALIKFLWNTAAAAQSHMATVHHHGNSQGQQYTALSREHEEMETGKLKFTLAFILN